ncbi:MAG: U32 family peptidase [Proteobacteria bacterium]|nr:U32 family peptidase [Pseudomonadota bacterium]
MPDRTAKASTAGNRAALTLGPLLFNWPVEKWKDFYARVADEAPVDVVCLGEVVCSKRLAFYVDVIYEAAERLRAAGKTVVLSTLALITLPRERKECAELVRSAEFDIELNDLTALSYLEKTRPFRVGPFVNVYNEGTLQFLARRGAVSVCFPPELSLGAVEALSRAAASMGIEAEVWSFGRIPLAIAGRCYHARVEGLTKDSCQFVCARDSDGLDVKTLDGNPFLAINGVQTLSHTYCNLAADLDRLREAGVASFRLSPHSGDMAAVAQAFRDRLDGRIAKDEAWAKISGASGATAFSNGFLFGKSGVEMVR